MSVDCSDSDLTDLADKIRDFHTDVSSRVGRTSAAALVPWLTAVCVRTPGDPEAAPSGSPPSESWKSPREADRGRSVAAHRL